MHKRRQMKITTMFQSRKNAHIQHNKVEEPVSGSLAIFTPPQLKIVFSEVTISLALSGQGTVKSGAEKRMFICGPQSRAWAGSSFSGPAILATAESKADVGELES